MPSQPLLTQLPAESVGRAPLQFVDSLKPSPDGAVDNVAHPVHSTLMHSLGGDTDAIPHLLFEHASAVRDRFKHLLAGTNDELGSSRWRGARRSATKSAIVKSVSCPTAETTGAGLLRSPGQPLLR